MGKDSPLAFLPAIINHLVVPFASRFCTFVCELNSRQPLRMLPAVRTWQAFGCSPCSYATGMNARWVQIVSVRETKVHTAGCCVAASGSGFVRSHPFELWSHRQQLNQSNCMLGAVACTCPSLSPPSLLPFHKRSQLLPYSLRYDSSPNLRIVALRFLDFDALMISRSFISSSRSSAIQ